MRQLPLDQMPTLHHDEPVTVEAPWLVLHRDCCRDLREPVGPAGQGPTARPAPGAVQMAAAHMKRRIDKEVPTLPAKTPEFDPLRVADQPRRLVVPGAIIGVEVSDPEGYGQAVTLLTGGPAGRGLVHAENLILPATRHFQTLSLCL